MAAAYSLAQDVALRDWNTLRVPATASWVATVHDAAALETVLALPQLRGLPALVLGAGSNILFTGDYPGVVLRLAFDRADIIEEAGGAALVRVDAGFAWDRLVDWSLQRGLCGLENLALIPGLTGAAPIQNIGAYGTEVAAVISAVEAYDRHAGRILRIDATDCGFSYRNSVFKSDLERWIVCAVELRLPRQRALSLDYAGVREELTAMGIPAPSACDVAEAVRRLRRRKLPDPAVIGNAGSFFKNPIVPSRLAEQLRAAHPALPVYPAADSHHKLSAAWLIEASGWRGFREGDAGISAQHALVLVNHGHATGAQLLSVARRVASSVQERFGVTLEPEPRIVGTGF